MYSALVGQRSTAPRGAVEGAWLSWRVAERWSWWRRRRRRRAG